MRQKTDLPVIFLTSKDDEIDELFGLKMGADDFIQQAVLAAPAGRAGEGGAAPGRPKDGTAPPTSLARPSSAASWSWTPTAMPAPGKTRPVTLTVTEFLILQSLAQRPGIVKSRDALMDAAYDDQVYVDDRTIDSHIKRLRKKFKQVDDQFEAIETLYGVGYRFKEA